MNTDFCKAVKLCDFAERLGLFVSKTIVTGNYVSFFFGKRLNCFLNAVYSIFLKIFFFDRVFLIFIKKRKNCFIIDITFAGFFASADSTLNFVADIPFCVCSKTEAFFSVKTVYGFNKSDNGFAD